MKMLSKKSMENFKKEYDNGNNKMVNWIIDDILNQGNRRECNNYIDDVVNYGCVSGVVSSLIYYYQTEKFYDTFKDEILELINDLQFEYGYSLLDKYFEEENLCKDDFFGYNEEDDEYFYLEDDELIEEVSSQGYNIKNYLSWLAYEEITYRLYLLMEE